MKKFYSTAIAALCALGVSATINVDRIRTNFSTENKKASEQVVKADREMRNQMRKNATMKKIASRAGEEQSIVGEYIISLGDYYFDDSEGSVEAIATITQEGSTIFIDCEEYFLTSAVAEYDETAGTLTFYTLKLGEIAGYYVAVEPFEYDYATKKPVVGQFTAEYKAENGTITFPADHGIAWGAYTDPKYGMKKGYLGAYDLEEMERSEHWQSLGEAVVTDNAFTPYFAPDADVESYSAKIYESTVYDGLYKVLNPWKGLYNALDIAAQSPKIYVDASYPDNVLLYLTAIGLTNEDGNLYLAMNYGFYCAAYTENQIPQDKFTTFTEEDNIATITFEPGSIMVGPQTDKGISLRSIGAEASTIVFYANGNAGESSGVSDIAVDENAPVEYFNLQGVRIDNPAAGQIVIKRQGAKVTKTIVR